MPVLCHSLRGGADRGFPKPTTVHKLTSTHVLHARDCIDFCTRKHARRTSCTRLACTNMYERSQCMHVITPCAILFWFSTLPDFFSQFFVCAEGKRPRFFFCMFFRMPGERNFNRCAAYFSFVVEIFKFVWYHLGLLMAWLVSWISMFFCLYCVHKQLPFIFQTIKNMQRIVNSVFLNNVVKNDTIVGFVMLYVCMYI